MPSLWQECSALWKLAWPVSLTASATMSMSVVDTIMVGRLGTETLAASALAGVYMYSASSFPRNLSIGAVPLVSQALGAKRLGLLPDIFWSSVLINVLLLFPLVALYWFSPNILIALAQETELSILAGQYCRVLIVSLPAMLLFSIVMRFLQSLERVKELTIAAVICNFINVAGNWFFMYELELGLVGCAISTVICETLILVFAVWMARDVLIRIIFASPSFRQLATVWRLGWPSSLQTSTEGWGFSASVLIAGMLGASMVAAHSIVLNVLTVLFMLPLGFSVAIGVVTGKRVGAQLDWWPSAKAGFALTVAAQLGSAGVLFVLGEHLASVYTSEVHLQELAASAFKICAWFIVADGLQVVGFGVLRSLADVRIPVWFNVIGYWVVGLPIGAWLALRVKWGIDGLWTALAVSLSLIALLCWLRILYWKKHGVDAIYEAENEGRAE